MKRLRYSSGATTTLRDDMTWIDYDGRPDIVLNRLTEEILAAHGPADGFPRERVFYELARRSGASKVEDDEQLPEDKGIVY